MALFRRALRIRSSTDLRFGRDMQPHVCDALGTARLVSGPPDYHEARMVLSPARESTAMDVQ